MNKQETSQSAECSNEAPLQLGNRLLRFLGSWHWTVQLSAIGFRLCFMKSFTMRYLIFLFLLITDAAFGQSVVEKGKAFFDQKNFAEATRLLKTVSEKENDYAAARYYLGRIAFIQKEFDDAVDYFQEATEAKNGEVAEYYNWLGNTYGTIAGEANVFRQGILAPKMKSAWEKAIALDERNVEARLSLIQYYTKAPSIMGGSTEKAKEMARQIIAINPAQGHRSMGNLLVSEKNIVDAEKEFKEMVRLDPATAPWLWNFYLSQKAYDKSFALFDEALKKNPEDMGATYQLGRTCAVSGQRLADGEACLLKYLAYSPKVNEPSHAAANMRLAQIYEKKGKKADAKVKYEAALKIDNTLQEAKDGLSRVSNP